MKDSDDEADTETNDESEDFDFSGVKVETFFTVAFLFELGLVLVAALVGYMTSGTPFPFELKLNDYQWVLRGFGYGVLATLPPAIFAFFATSSIGLRLGAMRRMYDRVKSLIGTSLVQLSAWEILLLAASAGVGEEILFRGVLQPTLGIVTTSVLFGMLHWLSTTYFVLASLMGFYCGWLFGVTGDNLLAPITVHWLYDAVALFLFQHRVRRDRERNEATPTGPESLRGGDSATIDTEEDADAGLSPPPNQDREGDSDEG